MRKSFLALLLSVLLTAALLSQGIPSAYAAAGMKSYAQSRIPGEEFLLTIDKTTLNFSSLPKRNDFQLIQFSLFKHGTTKITYDMLVNRTAEYTASFDIGKQADGLYDAIIYNASSTSKYVTYYSEFLLEISGGNAIVRLSEAYDHNMEVFSSRRTDREALNYLLLPSKGVESDNTKIIERAKSITKGAVTDYQKLKALYIWVTENVWYNLDYYYGYAPRDPNTAIDTLNSGIAVCEGYANLLVALSRAVGIPSVLVGGYTIDYDEEWNLPYLENGVENHAWVEAYVNGRWIVLDPTWDTENQYNGGKKSAPTGMQNTRFFDITLEAFSKDHYLGYNLDTRLPYNGFIIVDNEVIGYVGTGSIAVVPEFVTTIRSYSISGNTQLQRLIISNGVYKVSAYAVTQCPNLDFIYIPPSVYSIAPNSFHDTAPQTDIAGALNTNAKSIASLYGYGYSFLEVNTAQYALSSFQKVRTGDFTDNTSWGRDSVISAYEYGLIGGKGDGRFCPRDSLTVIEAISIAARIRSVYQFGFDIFTGINSNISWYEPYLLFAEQSGLIDSGEFSGLYHRACTRAEMIHIWRHILLDKDSPSINTVTRITDVQNSRDYYDDILFAYKAGWVGGTTSGGFEPDGEITRESCAVVFLRIILPGQRIAGHKYQ